MDLKRVSAPRKSRKDDILRTFTEMVAERGYDAVSIRDVAEALEISKGTILHHYTSKDRLLERVHGEYMTRRLVEAKRILERLNDPVEQLAGLVYQLVAAMDHDRAATIAFAREILRFASDDTMADVRGMRREYQHLLRSVIERGMEAGSFRRANSSIVTLQIFGMVNWVWTWYHPGGEWTLDEIGATFIGTLLQGLAVSARDLDAAWHARVVGTVRLVTAEQVNGARRDAVSLS